MTTQLEQIIYGFAQTPATNDVLTWNGAKWINQPLTTGIGTLGVTHGGTGTATAFTQGSVIFAGASGIYSQDNSLFFWDDTNHRLGIGTNSPSYSIHSSSSVNGPLAITVTNTLSSASALAAYNGINNLGHQFQCGITSSTTAASGMLLSDSAFFRYVGGPGGNGLGISTTSTAPIRFGTGNAEAFRIDQTNNALIIGATTTPAAMLEISGSVLSGFDILMQNNEGLGWRDSGGTPVMALFWDGGDVLNITGGIGGANFYVSELGILVFSIDSSGNFSFQQGNVSYGQGTVTYGGLIVNYNGVATQGNGVPSIYGYGRLTAKTSAQTNIAPYTVSNADGSYLISANVLITTSTLHNFTVTCAYTDESSTSRVLTLNFSQLTGTFVTAITNVTGAGAYEGVPVHIRAKINTAITISTTGTFTTVTYNVEGAITKIA